MLEEVPKEGEGPKMKGSVMLALAESKGRCSKHCKRTSTINQVFGIGKKCRSIQ